MTTFLAAVWLVICKVWSNVWGGVFPTAMITNIFTPLICTFESFPSTCWPTEQREFFYPLLWLQVLTIWKERRASTLKGFTFLWIFNMGFFFYWLQCYYLNSNVAIENDMLEHRQTKALLISVGYFCSIYSGMHSNTRHTHTTTFKVPKWNVSVWHFSIRILLSTWKTDWRFSNPRRV